MAKKKLRIALLGLGTVGRGVYDYITERDDMELAYVLSLVLFDGITCPVAKNMEQILADETVDTVVEVIGGLHPAYEWVKASLEAGKNVITANKLLIAAHYRELVELAEEKHVALRCTAAAGGGIPWLTTLARTIEQEPVIHISGIMNGTTNFILDRMHTTDVGYAEALHEAQELGYAERDPSSDVSGADIRRKLVISSNIAYGRVIDEMALQGKHIFNAIAACGGAQDWSAAKKMIQTTPRYAAVKREKIDPRDAIDMILSSGGFAILAHPHLIMSRPRGMTRA